MTHSEPWLNLKKVLERLDISEKTALNMIQRGELPAFRVGGQWRFKVSEIERQLRYTPPGLNETPGSGEDTNHE